MVAWYQGKRFFQIRPQLIRSPRFAGIISSGDQPAAEAGGGAFESAHVIPLPAVE